MPCRKISIRPAQVSTSPLVHGRSSHRTLRSPATSKCCFLWTRLSTSLTISRKLISESRADHSLISLLHLTERTWYCSHIPGCYGWFLQTSNGAWPNSIQTKSPALVDLSDRSNGARTTLSSSRGRVWFSSLALLGIRYSQPRSPLFYSTIQ